ncbi:ribonuclease III [Marinicella sp. S1101]|uniref:ribonuclease III n=1 Tax=Marinicella marina TaxID=2996016 RepID=UPI002260F865|nr:ribonuclease III [Marinicella marina]MCX7555015.1 ribonuclease III [Marinicella marina]MDJ1141321.1 ribonuclease III [Marinicella marina]
MKILGQSINWQDASLVQQALTHRSVGKTNNERLEFLGDSVLSLVVSNYLYRKFQNLTEGELSRLRSQIVKGKTLAEVARFYELGPMIKLGAGEIKSGGVNKSSVLADAVEAVFGAVLLDQGYAIADQFIAEVMQPWLEKIDPSIIKKDAKSELQEILQQQGYNTPNYKLLESFEVKNETRFKVVCQVEELELQIESTGGSIKKAEQSAANKMITALRSV